LVSLSPHPFSGLTAVSESASRRRIAKERVCEMAEQVSVTNLPDSGSPARVAFDLMGRIANAEYIRNGNKAPDNPREYYLELFKACRSEVY
jgi:hypothetical protein